MIPPPSPPVTDAELALLDRLWADAPQTARGLAAALYPAGTPSDVATVQTLLSRLEGKSLVRRDRTARAHAFFPTTTRDEYAGGRLAELADRLSDGSLAPLLLHLVSSRRLSRSELAGLRRLLDEPPGRRAPTGAAKPAKPRKGTA